MLMEGASIRCIAGHFDGGMHDWPSKEEKNSESALKSGRFAQLRGHWAYKEEHKISGDLGALQAAVAALQAKMEDRQDE
jgi:hypothetical protein